MASAIWCIMYDLQMDREAEYLTWFHDVHIPEKLARPGYTWAAHYRVRRDGDTNRYIALFGGESSAVFYNPSPAQIKPTQKPLTRDMMSCRSNAASLIMADEWTGVGLGAAETAIASKVISFAALDAPGQDEAFGAWLVQKYLKTVAQLGMRKFLASTGGAKHVVITMGEAGAWKDQAPDYLEYPLGDPLTAERVWPDWPSD